MQDAVVGDHLYSNYHQEARCGKLEGQKPREPVAHMLLAVTKNHSESNKHSQGCCSKLIYLMGIAREEEVQVHERGPRKPAHFCTISNISSGEIKVRVNGVHVTLSLASKN